MSGLADNTIGRAWPDRGSKHRGHVGLETEVEDAEVKRGVQKECNLHLRSSLTLIPAIVPTTFDFDVSPLRRTLLFSTERFHPNRYTTPPPNDYTFFFFTSVA